MKAIGLNFHSQWRSPQKVPQEPRHMDAPTQTQEERSSRKEVIQETVRSDLVVTCSQTGKDIKTDARSQICSQGEISRREAVTQKSIRSDRVVTCSQRDHSSLAW